MKTHRIWTIATVCWFFALFNVERLFPQVDIASFVYGLATLIGVSMLAFPFLRRRSFGLVSAGFGIIWIVGKCLLGYSVDLSALPIAFAEASALLVSQYLCLKVALNSDEFEETSRQMLAVLRATSVPMLHESEPALLEEIRRARRHERPLTFVSLSPGAVTSDALAGIVQRVTESLSREYVVGGISRILQRETKSHDMAVRVGDQILMLLPETDVTQAKAMCRRIQNTVGEQLHIPMNSEVFAFGSDELTLSGLLDRIGAQSRDNWASNAEVFELRPSRTILSRASGNAS
jgi:GGDEF domain-containing protein